MELLRGKNAVQMMTEPLSSWKQKGKKSSILGELFNTHLTPTRRVCSLLRSPLSEIGFQDCIRSYRPEGEQPDLGEPKTEVPALLIMGEKDYVLKIPEMEDYIRDGQAKAYVLNLEIKYMPEGSHFVQGQFPDEVNQLLLDFLRSQT